MEIKLCLAIVKLAGLADKIFITNIYTRYIISLNQMHRIFLAPCPPPLPRKNMYKQCIFYKNNFI